MGLWGSCSRPKLRPKTKLLPGPLGLGYHHLEHLFHKQYLNAWQSSLAMDLIVTKKVVEISDPS